METGLQDEKKTAYFIDFNLKELTNIGNILLAEHKPVNIDYDTKYKIKKEIDAKDVEVIEEKSIYNEKNMKKFKDIKASKKYMRNEIFCNYCKI